MRLYLEMEGAEAVENWNEKALTLYTEGKKINDIAIELELSRKTVSKYINSLPCSVLEETKRIRKDISANKRKKQKKAYRDRTSEVEKAQLKRQHEIDVMVLSSEKYFN